MSLFEDKRYQYRETFFVLFEQQNRPSQELIESTLSELGPKYETVDVRQNDGVLESITVKSPYDFSAMDITYVEGNDVTIQIKEIEEEFRTLTLQRDDIDKLMRLKTCDARFDIFHFEQVVDGGNEEEFMDPGGLLLVLEKLAKVCKGVGFDPQSQALM